MFELYLVLFICIKWVYKLRGQKVIVVDIRKYEMVECFDLFVQLCVGLDIVWLNVIVKYLIENGKVDE